MGASRITQAQKDHYWTLRSQGYSIRRASREAGFSEASAKNFEKQRGNGRVYREVRAARDIPDTPIALGEICAEARAALEDRTGFLWMKRYFGLELEPWQMLSWEAEEDAWDSRDREFLLENGPPGGGKTTQKSGFVSKRIAADRAIRVLFISRAHSLSERNTMRVRRALERVTPAVGADATIAGDFGRFKPRQGGDVWKRDEFVVVQMDGSPIEEKEPTVSAFGFDSEWIGNRIELAICDDLDSTRSTRNMDIVEKNREVFDNELEPRLEPGGLFVVTQQRLGAFDFSAHCRSKVVGPLDDGTDEAPEGVAQYHHLVFRAHYEDVCAGLPVAEQRRLHSHDAPAWPNGCLLAPKRLGWRDVRKAMNNPERFKVVYQQEDPGEDDALVQKIWVDGGRGTDGVNYLGCWDVGRGAWDLPRDSGGQVSLTRPLVGYVTVDPSPTRYWSIQAWVHHPDSEQRFLLDHYRGRLDPTEFLEWSHDQQSFSGIADEWWSNFERLGVKLRYIIMERNAAQRWVYGTDAWTRWRRLRQVDVIEHETHRNKSDPDYGVQFLLRSVWREGRVRLPKVGVGRIASIRLVDEVLRWPHTPTEDCVMSQWFLEHNLVRLSKRNTTPPPPRTQPKWLSGSIKNARRLVGAA